WIRQVSCYTLLSGCRLPWPPSCCLYPPTPFLGSAVRPRVGHLNRQHSIAAAPIRRAGLLTHLKFENRSRTFRPRDL
ncbi:hypothetical protein CAPTEDRAFT_98192, partial [Capitella teleta]